MPDLRVQGFLAHLALLTATAAAAQGAKPLAVSYGLDGDALTVGFDVRSVFDEALSRTLDSGLTNRVLISVSLRPLEVDGVGDPVSVSIRQCSIVFDLWGERYGVEILQDGRRARRIVEDPAAVAAACAQVEGLVIASLGVMDLRRRYVVEVRVDVNPVDPELLEKTREYLGDPTGHRRVGRSGGGALFGAVAQIFFRGPTPSSDSLWRFRSAAFGVEEMAELLARTRAPSRVDTEDEE